MFLVKFVMDSYGMDTKNRKEHIVGYLKSEESAKKFCKEETELLVYNKDMGNAYYTFTEVKLLDVKEEETNTLNDIDNILSNPDNFRF